MKLLIVLSVIASVAAGAAFVHVAREDAGTRAVSAASSGSYAAHTGDTSGAPAASAIERLERSIKLITPSLSSHKSSVGDFRLT